MAKGFTLLEVLLALLVMSIGFAALVQSAQTNASTLAQLQQSSAAHQVADQVMMQMYQSTGLQSGAHQGQQTFEAVDWHWQAEVSATDNPRIVKVDVKVYLDRSQDHALAQLTGFKAK